MYRYPPPVLHAHGTYQTSVVNPGSSHAATSPISNIRNSGFHRDTFVSDAIDKGFVAGVEFIGPGVHSQRDLYIQLCIKEARERDLESKFGTKKDYIQSHLERNFFPKSNDLIEAFSHLTSSELHKKATSALESSWQEHVASWNDSPAYKQTVDKAEAVWREAVTHYLTRRKAAAMRYRIFQNNMDSASTESPTALDNIVYFQGAKFEAFPLSANLFISALDPIRKMDVVGVTSNIDYDATNNKKQAEEFLRTILDEVLENHPQRLNEIEDESRIAFSTSNDHSSILTDAVNEWTNADSGYHVLMNFHLTTPKPDDGTRLTLESALWLRDKEKQIDDYCYGFASHFRSANEVPVASAILRDDFSRLEELTFNLDNFLATQGVDLKGTTLAHGVVASDPELYSVAVDLNAYLNAFLNGNLILHNSFLATTSSMDVARNFTGLHDIPLDNPLGVVDINDHLPQALAYKKSIINQIQSNSDAAAVIHLFQCEEGVKGAVVNHSTIEDYTGPEEDEILIPSNTVAVPDKLIYGKDYYVLISKLFPLENEDLMNNRDG